MQRTLKNSVGFVGIGLHSGRPARMLLQPATQGYGIKFRRTDVKDVDNFVAATWDQVCSTKLSSNIRNSAGVTVSTIEHIMAALAGCGITNALIDIDGPEIPIMDGSSKPFVMKILKIGVELQENGFVWQIRKTVSVRDGAAFVELSPLDYCEIGVSISFENTVIGDQSAMLDMRGPAFIDELANCRTFCLDSEIETMKNAGLALGGSYDNALVIDEDQYLNPEGPRRIDECVRHKILDAVGDLALAGAPILGRYTGVRSGHRMTNLLLRKLFATKGAAVKIPVDAQIIKVLPSSDEREFDLLRAG